MDEFLGFPRRERVNRAGQHQSTERLFWFLLRQQKELVRYRR